MLASNTTLTTLCLGHASYTNQDWAMTILPALHDNNSLKTLFLNKCPGMEGGLVYDALLELVDSNTCRRDLSFYNTPLQEEGKQTVVDAAISANREYRAILKDVPTTVTTLCRLVLCGYPCAGKSTLLQTMIRRQSSHAHSALQASLSLQSSERTRGIDIQEVRINDLTLWIWDFAGQREFHPLEDFIFPNGTSVHAATAFIFTFNPISSEGMGSAVKGESQFQQEFSYWLGFICSNSKPRPSRKYKPLVFVVVTHKDQVEISMDMGSVVTEWVRKLTTQFEGMVTLDISHVFFVVATDKDDLEFSNFERQVINALHTPISHVPRVPTVCDAVAKALGEGGSQQLEPIISFVDFRRLCKSAAENLSSNGFNQEEALANLFSTAGDKGCKAVAAYLRDAGEILYFQDLDFIVRNPRWFAHGILGHLIEIPSVGKGMFHNGFVSKGFLTDVLSKAIDIVGLNPAATNTDQLILLMEKLDLCYRTPKEYLIPAFFKDEQSKADKGECKRKWELEPSSDHHRCTFVTRRLQCSDPFRTFITPGFFPRLQVVLKSMVDKWGLKMKFGKCTCDLEKGFCRLIVNDMEILVEYSGYFDYFVDIMVKAYLPQPQTIEFLEAKIISKIRRLCASPKGCQGVTLVEAIIRPDCCDGGDITLCRFRQAVQVATLKQELVHAPDLRYCFPSVQDEHGTTILRRKYYHPRNLLDTNSTIWEHSACYPDSNVNAGKRRGVAVIVSMLTYNKSGHRSGGLQDQAKLTTLVGDLEFNVKLLQDSKAGELRRQIKDIADTRICAQDESFLCFVMGHGDSTVDGEHFIWDQDGDVIMLDNIMKPFRKCQHLQGKPKVFFVISCRGSNLPLVPPQPQVHVQQPLELKFNDGAEVRYLQDLTDCLTVFSTSIGSPSARYPGYGTTFVGAFVKSLNHDKLH